MVKVALIAEYVALRLTFVFHGKRDVLVIVDVDVNLARVH